MLIAGRQLDKSSLCKVQRAAERQLVQQMKHQLFIGRVGVGGRSSSYEAPCSSYKRLAMNLAIAARRV